MNFSNQLLINVDPNWIGLAIIENDVRRFDLRPLGWFNDEGNPLSKEEIIGLGYYGILDQTNINFDPDIEKIVENDINDYILDEENHTLTKTYTVVPYTKIELSNFARHKRDYYLQLSDVLVYVDRWETYDDDKKTTIKTYRENLRNVPQQENFPYSIDWPELQLNFNSDWTPPEPLRVIE